MSQLLIRRNYSEFSGSNVKRNTFSLPDNEYLSIDPTKLHNIPYPLPQIAIKKTGNSHIVDELQVALINGSWDTSERIPSIVAEMQNTCAQYDSNTQKENDTEVDKNLSWLLDFKFQELPPIPGMSH